MKLSHSFSARLSFYILLITAFLFIISISIVAFSSHKLIKEEATKSATNILTATIRDIEKVLIEVETAVQNLQWVAEENLKDSSYLYHITERMISDNKNIMGSAIAFDPGFFEGLHYFSPYSYLNENGEIISKQLGSSQYDYHSMDWYQIPYLLKEPYWTEPYYDEGGGAKIMTTYSRPLINIKGEVYGIITADVSLDWLRKRILSIKPYENAYTLLVGRSGTYIVHYKTERILHETIFTSAMEMQDTTARHIGMEMVAGHKGLIEFKNDEDEAFAVFAPISNKWSVAIICPYKDVLQRTMEMNLILILVASFGLFLLFVLCLITIRRLTRPLSQFSNSALSIAKGNFDTKLPVIKSNDEMKQLYDSFDYMQKSLTSYISELKTTTAVKERIESELSIARDIQMSMVPKTFPPFPGNPEIDLYAIIVPAKEVGGDLYDYFIDSGKLYFTIGDVSGKGVPASMFMAITRSAFRYVAGLRLSADRILYEINNSIAQSNDSNMFITMFVGILDLETGDLEFCNAGHNPLLLISPQGKASYISVIPNLVVGLVAGFDYKPQQMHIEHNSYLFLYTDGVTEAENEQKELFGEERLATVLNNTPLGHPQAIIQDVKNHLAQFTDTAEQNDDITIVTIQYH